MNLPIVDIVVVVDFSLQLILQEEATTPDDKEQQEKTKKTKATLLSKLDSLQLILDKNSQLILVFPSSERRPLKFRINSSIILTRHFLDNHREHVGYLGNDGSLLSLMLPSDFGFSSVDSAVNSFRQGKMCIVLDDEERENEGDLILPAQDCTPVQIAFMIQHTTGIICVPMLAGDLDRLRIPQMVPVNTDSFETAFTVTVDSAHGITTGVSAADRCATINALSRLDSIPADFKRPGHVFPLRARDGGVVERGGHTEAAIGALRSYEDGAFSSSDPVDLCRLSNKNPVGCIAELTNPKTGEMLRTKELLMFAHLYQLEIITIQSLKEYLYAQASPQVGM